MKNPGAVVVIGGGINGLSTALRLLEETTGIDVTLIADRFDEETTTSGAAGLWEPYKLSETPNHLIRKWGSETFHFLQRLLLSESAAAAGVSETTAYQFWTSPRDDPDWADIVPHFRRLTVEELGPYNLSAGGRLKAGWAFSTLICEGALHLKWLRKQFIAAGGKIIQRKIADLEEVANFDAVINCTGLGAAELFGDKSMYPIRGHVIRVKAPWIKSIYFTDEQTYVIPNSDTVVLGGTGQIGDWSTEPRQEDREQILERCQKMLPSLAHAEVVREWVGLRPGRTSVRLEPGTMQLPHGKQLLVVHNYGHGGAGLTLAWGCAGDAVKLCCSILGQKSKL